MIEWILSSEGITSDKSNIERLIPVFIGRRDKISGSINDPFKDSYFPLNLTDDRNIFQCLPDSPTDLLLVTSLDKARKLLTENGIQPNNKLDQITTKSIVDSLLDQLGLFLNKCKRQDDEFFVEEICRSANDILKDHVTSLNKVIYV